MKRLIIVTTIDSGKELSKINKEIADLQNTDMFGNVRSITEAVRAAQTERQERLKFAEMERDLEIAKMAMNSQYYKQEDLLA